MQSLESIKTYIYHTSILSSKRSV